MHYDKPVSTYEAENSDKYLTLRTEQKNGFFRDL